MYADTHFPNHEILQVTKDTDNGAITYDVALEGNIELEFNEAKEITEIDATTQLPNSVIMVEIQNYVQANYPSQVITSWELKLSEQHIELNNDVDLVFDLEGIFLRIGD